MTHFKPLKAARAFCGLSAEHLAAAIGIDINALTRIETKTIVEIMSSSPMRTLYGRLIAHYYTLNVSVSPTGVNALAEGFFKSEAGARPKQSR